MKNTTLIAATVATALFSANAFAKQPEPQYTDAKQAGTILTTTTTGFIAGGPLGALAGMVAGAWFNQNIEGADHAVVLSNDLETAQLQLQETEQLLAKQRLQLEKMEDEVAKQGKIAEQYAKQMLEQLQLAMLFKTNQSELTDAAKNRLSLLAQYLNRNPEMKVHLDGYADPRGNADYNLQLSQARVDAVAQQLFEAGVSADRITSQSHGATLSTANKGDYDAYALERVVSIELTKGDNVSVAKVNYNN
ncbi:OmpA family protein [Corallincola platygyrae]|uniref:OmpA family protein n=1 Tax=Corallincola platygyrae TaxID=1193278 RepID=A0ABW4XH72_9GAMM